MLHRMLHWGNISRIYVHPRKTNPHFRPKSAHPWRIFCNIACNIVFLQLCNIASGIVPGTLTISGEKGSREKEEILQKNLGYFAPRRGTVFFYGPISFLCAKKKRGRLPKKKRFILSGAPAPFLTYPPQLLLLPTKLPDAVRFFLAASRRGLGSDYIAITD